MLGKMVGEDEDFPGHGKSLHMCTLEKRLFLSFRPCTIHLALCLGGIAHSQYHVFLDSKHDRCFDPHGVEPMQDEKTEHPDVVDSAEGSSAAFKLEPDTSWLEWIVPLSSVDIAHDIAISEDALPEALLHELGLQKQPYKQMTRVSLLRPPHPEDSNDGGASVQRPSHSKLPHSGSSSRVRGCHENENTLLWILAHNSDSLREALLQSPAIVQQHSDEAWSARLESVADLAAAAQAGMPASSSVSKGRTRTEDPPQTPPQKQNQGDVEDKQGSCGAALPLPATNPSHNITTTSTSTTTNPSHNITTTSTSTTTTSTTTTTTSSSSSGSSSSGIGFASIPAMIGSTLSR